MKMKICRPCLINLDYDIQEWETGKSFRGNIEKKCEDIEYPNHCLFVLAHNLMEKYVYKGDSYESIPTTTGICQRCCQVN